MHFYLFLIFDEEGNLKQGLTLNDFINYLYVYRV